MRRAVMILLLGLAAVALSAPADEAAVAGPVDDPAAAIDPRTDVHGTETLEGQEQRWGGWNRGWGGGYWGGRGYGGGWGGRGYGGGWGGRGYGGGWGGRGYGGGWGGRGYGGGWGGRGYGGGRGWGGSYWG
ncbi:keratin-associated protein 19-2-like [Bacillus rossius redtenbacheri]|uniref:keratin-associated protein 19-2-like n=1 Tax=Bacillus rossius redtenbacheri TaxID=93214 RepID=UPI002FDD1162